MITLDYTLTRAHLLAFQKPIPQRLIEAGGPSYRRNRWILWFTLAFVAGTGTALLEHIIGHPPDELSSTAALLFGVGAMVALMAQRSRVVPCLLGQRLWSATGSSPRSRITARTRRLRHR